MKRVQGSRGVSLLECINPYRDRWAVRFDVCENGNEEPEWLAGGVNYMEEIVLHEPSLDEIKAIVSTGIDMYDNSPYVNRFTVNGIPMWLDKQTRASLCYTIETGEDSSLENDTPTIRLWSDGLPPSSFDVPKKDLRQMLTDLELYAKSTYDVTQTHKREVYSLKTAEEILSFDIRAGYPEQLVFKL